MEALLQTRLCDDQFSEAIHQFIAPVCEDAEADVSAVIVGMQFEDRAKHI
jgi:hypothetical protein